MTGGEFSDDFSTDRDIITYGMQFNATGYRVVWVHEVIVSGTVTYTQGAEKTVRLPTGVSWDMNNAYTAPYIDPIIPFAFDTTYPSINQAKTINNKPMFQINGSMKNSDTPPVRVLPYGAIPAPPEPLPANYVEYWTVAKINNTNGKTKFVVVVTATGAIMIRDLLP